MPVRHILSTVWVRLSIFSQLSITQYVGLCIFSLPISLVMIERIYILCLIIIIKSEVWTITHYLGLGHETMVCSVCLSIFLWAYIHNQGTIFSNVLCWLYLILWLFIFHRNKFGSKIFIQSQKVLIIYNNTLVSSLLSNWITKLGNCFSRWWRSLQKRCGAVITLSIFCNILTKDAL